MTVVMLVIDGIGHRSVTPELMPTLTAWALRGMARPEGATSVMCSSTYPNFASMVTGATPAAHGLFANEVAVDGSIIPAAEVGPAVPTFFDGSSEVIVGDHHLIGVTAAHGAGRHWPPSGVIPPGCSVDMFGYLTDQEVATRVVEAMERSPELLFVQLNSPDTFAHWFGPDSDEAIASYTQALRLRPQDASTANNLGYCLLERGEVEAARGWLERSVAADPGSAVAHNNLGNALRTQGDLAGALQRYRRAIELAPRFGHAHHNLALTLRDVGDS